jgi:hypothetical protein
MVAIRVHMGAFALYGRATYFASKTLKKSTMFMLDFLRYTSFFTINRKWLL